MIVAEPLLIISVVLLLTTCSPTTYHVVECDAHVMGREQ